MIFYLTYNDSPSGIFSSQVIDVVKFLNYKFDAKVKLLAFISIRNFGNNKHKIKTELPESIVLPMFPGVKYWRLNVITLFLLSVIYKPKAIIGRSVLATNLALMLKSTKKKLKIVYDGRGAIEAEWKEYNVITDKKMLGEVFELEKKAILNSDFKIAVSNELVKFWLEQFKYSKSNHVVIPCTLNSQFEDLEITDSKLKEAREKLGLKADDRVFIYSGSVAGWQSFDRLFEFIVPVLKQSPGNKIVFFSKHDEGIEKLNTLFPGQVIRKELKSNEVQNYLIAGNYGLLIREQSVTNRVASPVKFAEYLACGLSVIISDGIGDYSGFVSEQQCGCLANKFSYNNIESKMHLQKIANENFTKQSKSDCYEKLIRSVYE